MGGNYGSYVLGVCASVLLTVGTGAAATFAHRTAGYSLEYPDSWNIDQALLDVGGPFVISNFPGGGYLRGGLLPPGGVTLQVQTFPAGTDEEIALLPSGAERNVTRSVRAVGGRGVLRADYDLVFSRETTYKETAVTLKTREMLYVILVTYEQGRPSPGMARTGEAALARVLSTLAAGGKK